MSEKAMTIYEAKDRQGTKYFKSKPTFTAMHDVFEGERIEKPKRKCRIIRRFTAKIMHKGMSASFYPETIRVEP